MLACGALEHWIQGINVTAVRGNELLDALLPRTAARITWTGVRERAHLGLPPVFNEGLGERAFVDQEVRIADSRAIPSQGAVSPLKVTTLRSASMRKPKQADMSAGM